MAANLPELLPTCFVKCCWTLQESCSQTKNCLSPRCPNLKLLAYRWILPKIFSFSASFKIPLTPWAPFLSNQSQRLWTQTRQSGWGAEREKLSWLPALCVLPIRLWSVAAPFCKVKLFFLPCSVTPECFFDRHLGTTFLTVILKYIIDCFYIWLSFCATESEVLLPFCLCLVPLTELFLSFPCLSQSPMTTTPLQLSTF
jgi:hypothetical protein